MIDYWQCLKCWSVFNHEDDACPECGSQETQDIGDIKIHLKVESIEKEALETRVKELETIVHNINSDHPEVISLAKRLTKILAPQEGGE